MSALDQVRARELLLRVVDQYYTERHSPLPGAFVKARMLAEAQRDNVIFSERDLGFRRFRDFVQTVPEIAIQDRPGSDILLGPSTAADVMAAYASPLPRLRRDFWRAFIEFPIQNTVRFYDPAKDKIFREDAATSRQGIIIEPISREMQLQWRRTFSEEQPEGLRNELLAALQATGTTVFNEFSRRLREDPSVMRAWNRYLQKQVTDRVSAWAIANDVPNERWLAASYTGADFCPTGESAPPKPNLGQRAELYNFFDQLPIENLLELRVPLEWVLKVMRRGD